MKKNIEPCANCLSDIYQASDSEWFHLKTGNKYCGWGETHAGPPVYMGKIATPKEKAA